MDAPWIEELEQRVRQATEEIGRLRKENRRLQKQIEADGGPDDQEDWQQERDEVRRRVERLAAHLAELLGEEV